ncbi:hypothetical protein OIDMADRAFT_153816 [Oidiodendron maius Zn]|uniref:DUF2293 domain-containing protein n=1 Tax=Oidiodendron maius (strain Zn) TaxID=913774 RepID=A0A0C3HBD9_OIDMZ|nr:hypothetical protein OIDMADRAFT_153816 [Oidiodendron maius Zn]
MGKKKKAAAVAAKAAAVARAARRTAREERKIARSAKKEHKKRDRKAYTADMWAVPAPSHLVARLEIPKHKSKYHSYFEFAENTEKKKRLEFKVTDDSNPPPGFRFVPIGHPALTNACKELSRERDAMIFIVSGSKEENSKISEHIYRTGYHFRESIVDEALKLVGETTISVAADGSRNPEPIPETQEEINKQADGAIRDLFPRIPNTDRQMIIEHAFQKGAMFHGEPTVGLQPDIPLSRRVQLAVLAHIRHTHTRYDQLLKETSWMNARKAVEPVCLDFIVKWRGDEETGRDQMDEILREVVIITDSEESDDSSEEDESTDEDGELTSSSSASMSQPASRNQNRLTLHQNQVSEPEEATRRKQDTERDKRTQRGFKRYQAAWDDAIHRLHAPETAPEGAASQDIAVRRRQDGIIPPVRSHTDNQHAVQMALGPRVATSSIMEQAPRSDIVNGRRQVSLFHAIYHVAFYWPCSTSSSSNGNRNLATYNKEQPLEYFRPGMR